MTTLTVVIPAYNEEKGITEIVQRVMSVRDALMGVGVSDLELLVVDDGSRDHTRDVLHELEPKYQGMRVICHPRNKGYGAALKTGFSQARGELIGFLDADGTYPPEYFPQLCKAAMAGSDLVIGSRMMGADSKMPLTRRIGNLFFANLLTLVGGIRVTDSASGMRVFQRSVYEKVVPLPDGLNLTPVMSTRAIHENLKVTEIAIPYSERVGRSKLSVIRDGRIFLESILWTAMYYNPVRILGIVGAVFILLSALVVIGFLTARLSGVQTLGAWGVVALFSALVNGVVGISIFSLGVSFNYLVTLFHKSPVRQGLFGRPLLKTPLEFSFGWIGLGTFLAGFVISVVTLALGISGWEMNRLWLYLAGSAMLILVGTQLMISWILIRILSELSMRDDMAARDMQPL